MNVPPVLLDLFVLPTVHLVVTGTDGVERWVDRNGATLVAVPLRIVLIVVLAVVARFVARRLIRRAVEHMVNGQQLDRLGGRAAGELDETGARLARERRRQRAKTVGSVLKSVTTITIVAIAAFMVLGELGVQLGPLIASAGVVGVALGFGSQSLVKDFLSGMFMLLEDQYGVGDHIDVGEATGIVEDVGLRITRLRDLDGALWYVRNGEILRVGNYSQGWARAVIDIPVGLDADIPRVRSLLKVIADRLWGEEEWKSLILEEPEVWGVEAINRDSVIVRMVVKTAPLKQWDVARELRERIKAKFEAQGIEIPYPQATIWMRTESPPAVQPDSERPDSGQPDTGRPETAEGRQDSAQRSAHP
ncbi:MAG: mechanosensitive ion channel family protein [Carbonactinosporaceae bacterium]